jgi:hypothetical protein
MFSPFSTAEDDSVIRAHARTGIAALFPTRYPARNPGGPQ